jgi:hypothetical protein
MSPGAADATLDSERRAALWRAKLAALARDVYGLAEGEPGGYPGGATLREGDRGWFYAVEAPSRSLGPALAWAQQRRLTDLWLLVDAVEAAGVLARRSQLFRDPPIVARIDGASVVDPSPAPFDGSPAQPRDVETLVALLEQAGVDIVVEHGQVIGEIRGLEIGRIIEDDVGPRLEVGVGRHDREAFAMVHGDLPTAEALQSVVSTVRRHRRPGGDAHALHRLAGEGWMRWAVVDDPALVGLDDLRPVEGLESRASVKDRAPAAAIGHDGHGEPVLVVCSVGVDLDLVPSAADLRLRERDRGRAVTRLLLVLPERDDHPVTRDLAGRLVEPAEVVPLGGAWRR